MEGSESRESLGASLTAVDHRHQLRKYFPVLSFNKSHMHNTNIKQEAFPLWCAQLLYLLSNGISKTSLIPLLKISRKVLAFLFTVVDCLILLKMSPYYLKPILPKISIWR